MSAPPRVVIAVTVAGVLVILALAAIMALHRAKTFGLSKTWRWLLMVAAPLVLLALAGWVLFIAPAYWD